MATSRLATQVANTIKSFQQDTGLGQYKENRSFRGTTVGAVQDYIPVKTIKNGYIETVDGRFLGVIEVYPVNFAKMPLSERYAIQKSYQKLFEGPIRKIQLKNMCDFFNANDLIENIKKAASKFTEPEIIRATNSYLEHIINYSNRNTVSHRYFIIFSYTGDMDGKMSKDINEIHRQLEEDEWFIRDTLESCGCLVHEPDNRNAFTAEFLYYFFNRKSSRVTSMQERYERIKEDYSAFNKETGMDKKPRYNDIIGSKGLYLANRNHMYMDGQYYTFLGILPNSYPEAVYPGWMSVIFDFFQYVDVDIHAKKLPKEFYQTMLSGINRTTVEGYNLSAKKGRSGRMEKLAGTFQNNNYVHNKMASGNEELWNSSIILTVKADTRAELHRVVRYIKTNLKKYQVKVEDSYARIEEYFSMSMPFLNFTSCFRKIKHDSLSSQLGSMFSYTAYSIYNPQGYLIGSNDANAILCINNFDTKRYMNGNMVILGKSGSGKTFTEQLIGSRCNMNAMRVFSIIPSKGYEYEPGCNMVNGTFIKYYPGSTDCVNVMEIRPSGKIDTSVFRDEDGIDAKEAESSYLAKQVTFLIYWLQLQTDNPNAIKTETFNLLQELIPQVYEKFGITFDNRSIFDENGEVKRMPIIGDMYEHFKKYEDAHEDVKASKVLSEYISVCKGWVTGAFKNMNGQTNVDMSKDYIVFDVDERYIGAKLIAACLYAAFTFVNNNVREHPLSRDIVILDEVWKMLKYKSCADQVKDMIKLIRGYGGCVILATQEIDDFINQSNGYGSSAINNSAIKLCLRPGDKDIELIRDPLRLSEEEERKVMALKKGSGFLIADNDRVFIKIVATDMERKVFSTDVNDRIRMAGGLL